MEQRRERARALRGEPLRFDLELRDVEAMELHGRLAYAQQMAAEHGVDIARPLRELEGRIRVLENRIRSRAGLRRLPTGTSSSTAEQPQQDSPGGHAPA